MRILFDRNVPVGVRRFLSGHSVQTFDETGWHAQLENGELLKAAEAAGFDVMITADQNIKHQQNLEGRRLSLVVLGSNIWPIVSNHAAAITTKVEEAVPGSLAVEMPVPPKRHALSPPK